MYSNFPFKPVYSNNYLSVACEINYPGSALPPGNPNSPFLSP
jgi:hypothetical protein